MSVALRSALFTFIVHGAHAYRLYGSGSRKASLGRPRNGVIWQWLARLRGFDRMVRSVSDLEPLAVEAGLAEITTGKVSL